MSGGCEGAGRKPQVEELCPRSWHPAALHHGAREHGESRPGHNELKRCNQGSGREKPVADISRGPRGSPWLQEPAGKRLLGRSTRCSGLLRAPPRQRPAYLLYIFIACKLNSPEPDIPPAHRTHSQSKSCHIFLGLSKIPPGPSVPRRRGVGEVPPWPSTALRLLQSSGREAGAMISAPKGSVTGGGTGEQRCGGRCCAQHRDLGGIPQRPCASRIVNTRP